MSDTAETNGPLAAPAWAAISLALFVAALFASLPIVAAARLVVDVPHLVEMAEWSLVWGVLSLAGVLAAGRLSFGTWLRPNRAAVVAGGAGIGLSGVVHVVLQQWAIARFGYYDPEIAWWTSGLFALLIGLATSAFGVFVAPRGAAGWPFAGVLLGAGAVLSILVGNLPGLGDGIAPESWPLAIWMGTSGLYAVAVSVAAVIRAWDR